MKKIYLIVLTFAIALAIAGCYKKPEASFTTNKTEYIAGDTVHLTNTSTNGHSYLWALPNGQTATTTNVDYLIPTNQGFATLTFILNAHSKLKMKSSSVTKTVDVIPASWFAIDSPSHFHRPFNISAGPGGNNWWINAYEGSKWISQLGTNVDNAGGAIFIELPGTTAPTSAATYLLQSNDTLLPGHAYIWIDRDWWELNKEDFVSLSGQLNITITNGKVHAVFSHISAKQSDGTAYFTKISGDITVP